jgi:transcriptional regulator with XRE-family HTH domain
MKSKLLEFREKMNLTQNELSKKSGISVRTIQRIEAGSKPKGYTLNELSKALEISKEELLGKSVDLTRYDFQLIRLINFSTLVFLIIPLGNVLLPLLVMFRKKEFNPITKQNISIQILWTIFSGVLILISPFIQRMFSIETQMVLVVFILSYSINLIIIIRNAISLGKHNHLFFKLNFSLI